MELRIEKMHLKNFKGVKDQEIKFYGKTKIAGQNGVGKTTIADSFFYVFCDCNTALVKNPPITPLGAEECESSVEIDLVLDGKALTVKKSQKFKTKIIDDKKTTSVSNSYEINSVEKSQRDFIADLENRGIDMENFLYLTHPNAFTADTSKAGRDKMRKVLFDMVEDVSDVDIAKDSGMNELAALLEDYKLEEIEQMNKSTLKKIKDEMGLDNSVINAKIDGMISSKTEVNVKELQELKAQFESQIAKCDAELEELAKGKDVNAEKLRELISKRDAMAMDAAMELENKKKYITNQIQLAESGLDIENKNLRGYENLLTELERRIVDSQEKLDNYRSLYKKVQDEVLDEDDLKCPTCQREYEPERIEEIKTQFEESKNERLNAYKRKGEEAKASLENAQSEYEDAKAKKSVLENAIEKTKRDIESLKAQFSMFPSSANLDGNAEYNKLVEEISNLENQSENTDADKARVIKEDKENAQRNLNEVIGHLALDTRNAEIDKKIESLREERRQAEINKAMAEKKLDMVDKFKRAKNERLTAEINKHFSLVEWQLWDLQKNGEYKEVTEPLIDGKPMTSCANGSLQTLAKVSICSDLQKARGVTYPIWCDDYSLCSSNTSQRIDTESQFIGLVVTEDREIKVEQE